MQKSGDNHHDAYSSFLFPKRLQKPMEAFLILINEGVPLTVLDHQRTVDSFLQLCYNLRRLPSEQGVCPVEKTASTPPDRIFFLALPGITANVTEVSTEDMPFPKVVDDDHFHDAHASKIPSLRDPGSSLRKMLLYRRILSKTMTTNRPIVHRTGKSIFPIIGKVCQHIQPIIVGDGRR
jgi:hypothetical protein